MAEPTLLPGGCALCPSCDGSGRSRSAPTCTTCDGGGRVTEGAAKRILEWRQKRKETP